MAGMSAPGHNNAAAAESLLCDERSKFVLEAADVVRLHFVADEDEFENDEGFAPEFVHQHFGENETIFGYSALQVDVYYSAADLQCCVRSGFHRGDTVDRVHRDMKADNIVEKIVEFWPPNQLHTIKAARGDMFAVLAKQVDCEPPGQVLQRYSATASGGHAGATSEYSIHWLRCDGAQWNKAARGLVARAQSVAMWYVDAAQHTDADDDKWSHFLLYERAAGAGGLCRFAGYASVYDFYAYPEHVRPRIAQILVLPPYRKMGHGARLLAAIYNHFIPDRKVLDITVEDPSDDFTYLRDLVDAHSCATLPGYAPALLKGGWSKRMAEEARTKFKIPHKQARRVYELLRLKHTDASSAGDVSAFAKCVKARLSLPFRRNRADLAKLSRALGEQEAAKYEAVNGEEHQEQQVHNMYEKTVAEYRRTLERVAVHGDHMPVIRPAPAAVRTSAPAHNGAAAESMLCDDVPVTRPAVGNDSSTTATVANGTHCPQVGGDILT